MSKQINTVQMTAEELESYKKFQAQEAKKNEAVKKQQDRDTYKTMLEETVAKLWDPLFELSETMRKAKDNVFANFKDAVALKESIYGIKTNQKSHSFTDSKGRTITIGHRTVDHYDDTAKMGIEKVKQYVASLAKDAQTSALVSTILDLLRCDEKGNPKPSRILELEKMARKFDSDELNDGIQIIKDAYCPKRTVNFVSASYKDENGEEVSVPLSMSAI